MAMAAISAVMVVPRFPPSVKGYTCFNVNTTLPAIGTIRAVVVEEDCTSTVKVKLMLSKLNAQ